MKYKMNEKEAEIKVIELINKGICFDSFDMEQWKYEFMKFGELYNPEKEIKDCKEVQR